MTLLCGALLLAQADFSKVESVLKKNCYGCHTGARPMAQLRLDSRASLVKGGVSGAALVPGAAAKSLLIQRVEGTGGQERMPPKMPALKADEIAALKAWVDAGAVWPGAAEAAPEIEKHWSYKKPVKAAAPVVRNAARVRNPMDAFLLARLEKQGLGFSAEASKETLIRRVSLDLTGLPPTPQEMDEFLADTRADAYERLVDRLLASPHFGERWARPWLDLARYADTNGYEKDRRRTMWKYRDWVIGAFNRDLPFDQFTIEQLAGDMLPNATTEQKIATGFHRNTMYNEEGGVDREEAHFEVLVDRVNTTGTVWLGTSLGCTQCHNHKYDPLTQKDYYSMMAFFSSAMKEAQHYGDTSVKWKEPVLELATKEQEAKRTQLAARIKELEAKLKTTTPALEAEQAAWEQKLRAAAQEWTVLAPTAMRSLHGAKLTAAGDAILVSGENPQRESYVIEGQARGTLSAVRIEALPHASLPRGGPGRDIYGNFIFTRVEVEVDGKPVELAKATPDDGRMPGPAARKNGEQFWIVDASKEDERLPRQIVLAFRRPVPAGRLKVTIVQDSEFVGQGVGHFRISTTGAAEPALIARLRHNLRGALEAAQRSETQTKQLAEFFRNSAPSLDAARDELKELRNEMDRLGIVTALVLEEKAGFERPFDHIRVRGGFASKGDKVYANTPGALPPLPEDALPNRLGLARWLVSRENPLTARVAVNRIWEQYFGRGIVETSEDFGVQGARPEHPELLDWLAVEFMDQKWSMKAMHRLIVTSSAYRQSSALTPALLQADPYNRLISRGPRFRLEAEMVRDAVLASAGLLDRKTGGPSVFPPQPPGVWDVPYSDDRWEESEGGDRYRRGLYTFVRRSAMYPAMMNFDATSREVCTVRRVRTNTPLQALTTLNDAAFFEAAQALGRRMVSEGGRDDASRVAYGYRVVTGRRPAAAEADRILSWLAREKAYFAGHAAEAKQVAGGEAALAPWTMLGNVLLNLDEALTKE